MKYPYLLFDADNTLFDFDKAERRAYDNVCRTHGLACSDSGYALYRQCNGELWHDFDRGLCTKEFLLVERFRRFLARSGQSAQPEELNRTHLETIAGSAFLLPGALEDTKRVLDWAAETFRPGQVLFSLMSQYTPQPGAEGLLSRRVTGGEYRAALAYMENLGILDGYRQDSSSAKEEYTPAFDLSGI